MIEMASPEIRKDQIFAEEESATIEEMTRVKNKWLSCVRTRLTVIVTSIEVARMDGVIDDEKANEYSRKASQVEDFVAALESKNLLEAGEPPTQEIKDKVLNRLVELRYELEQIIKII